MNKTKFLNGKRTGLTRQYLAALRAHLQQAPGSSSKPAQGLGRRAMAAGLETLDLARMHEQSMLALVLPDHSPANREVMVRQAGTFFSEVITPLEETHRAALEASVHLARLNQMLRQRSEDLSASNRQLKHEIHQRRSVEQSLRKSERHYGQLLEQSRLMQGQLRLISRQLLLAQEEERKKISRELHDVIAQTLTGINVRLAALKKDATANTQDLERSIAQTQRLVQQSVEIVHRFARELRPTVLDDLGLIPALHTFMKSFRAQTGIQVSLSAFVGIEQLSDDKRTVLYRVAQEALTNVARHAGASRATVRIQKLQGAVCIRIKDDGRGFRANPLSPGKKDQRLGLLGMRERVEMVGGKLSIASAPGKGTTVLAQVPLIDRTAGGG